MTKFSFAAAFAAGLAVVGWIGLGFAGSSWLPLVVTLAILAVYLLGAFELWQFRAASLGLQAALRGLAAAPAALPDWLAQVPAGLRTSVRLRVEGERVALPGPALTPYLVGLLVMLGMLGTFLGMVVTFKGAVFALEGSTDLQAIRGALAEPVRGLGLSFGTSVAGVAASAMLGLMAALCRRERVALGRALDAQVATVLQPFSLVHQRQEALRALQVQAHALPAVVDALQAMMGRIEARSQQLDAQLLERHAQFQRDATSAYTELARSVGRSLQDSLAGAARTAGDTIRPAVEQAMGRIVQESQGLHERLLAVAQASVDALAQQFEGRSSALLATVAEQESRLRDASQGLAQREQRALQERTALLQQLSDLLQSVNATAGEQRAATEALLASAASVLREAGARFTQVLQAQAGEAAGQAAQLAAGAVELRGVAERFGQGVEGFQAGNDKLVAGLLRIEASLQRSTARSDEQLAYYVAQAREVIDLSIASQQGLVDSLRELQGRPARGLARAQGVAA